MLNELIEEKVTTICKCDNPARGFILITEQLYKNYVIITPTVRYTICADCNKLVKNNVIQ